MASSNISVLLSCLLACLLISNGVSARLLENLFAKINQDAEDRKVTHYKRESSAEKSFAEAPASVPTHAVAPAPAPVNQFHSSASAAGQYAAMDVKPSTADEETEAKLNHDDDDDDDYNDDNDDVDDHDDHDDDDDHHDDDHDDDDRAHAMAPSPK